MRIIKYLLALATILIMALIFWLSAQPAEESTVMSNDIGYTIGEIFVPGFEEMDEPEQLEFVQSIDHPIRKFAHGSEYMLLGALCSGTFLAWLYKNRLFQRKRRFLLYLFGWLVSVLYAVSDEIHQIFVPGRACMFLDVLIDSAGAASGILLLMLVIFLVKRKQAKKQKQNY